MLDNYNILVNQLDAFIRKYYWNLIVKGFFFFLGGFIVSVLVIVLIEYFAYFKSTVRSSIFLAFLIGNTVTFGYFVFYPFALMLKLGNRLSFDQAAIIIGKHFKRNVDDKILNTLQLKRYLDSNPTNFDLINASIEQKSSLLQTYNFPSVIKVSQNFKYLIVFSIGFFIMISGWFLLPGIFQEPALRLVNYSIEYEKPAPFSVKLLNDFPLTVNRYDPLPLEIEITGNVLPSEFSIVSDKREYKMSGFRNNFSYEFRSVSESFTFFLRSGKFSFGPYTVVVNDKPTIKNFVVDIDYPEYTRLVNREVSNSGDLIVPVGSKVSWNIYTEDTDYLLFSFIDGERDTADFVRHNVFREGIVASEGFSYSIVAGNHSSSNFDSLSYNLTVIPDRFPDIRIDEYVDSLLKSSIFYRGLVSDDYGFTQLSFNYRISEGINVPEDFESVPLNFEKDILNQEFFYQLNLLEFPLEPGSNLDYYFEITDNDGINGFKSTKSSLYSFGVPTINELLAQSMASDDKLNSGISETSEELDELQKEIDDLRRNMLESESVTWEQQEVLKQLLDKQKMVEEKIQELQKENISQNKNSNNFREQDKNILEKQAQLEKLFEEVLSDDLKELYKQIQEELDKLDKDQYFDILDKMEFEIEDIEAKLDRALELFKQLQVERLLSESIDLLEKVNTDQDELIDSVSETGLDEATEEVQESINQDFDSLQDLLEEMLNKNEELTRPNDLKDTNDLEDEISEFLENSLESIQNSDLPNTQNSQNSASGKMQELREQLKQMQASMEQQNLAEDARMLREILDNLIKTSFNQESLMEDFNIVNVRDPKYVALIQNQRRIENDLVLIKDSLTALAKRQIQIQSIVSREISEINLNIGIAIENLIERRKHTAVSRQQFVMTHINNLALLLNESLNNLQNQMQAQGESGGEPQKGQGASGMQDLRQMQQQMNEMLEQLRQGHQPMPGESGQSSMSLSEQLARMAAEQEAIRNRLGEIMDEYKNSGNNPGDLNELLREMERTELDIVTNRITRQTQLRQERILTRLLEHERAMMEREKEERRVGETANFYDLSNPVDFFKYNNDRNSNREILKTLPPDFNNHYRSLVEKYFLNVQE